MVVDSCRCGGKVTTGRTGQGRIGRDTARQDGKDRPRQDGKARPRQDGKDRTRQYRKRMTGHGMVGMAGQDREGMDTVTQTQADYSHDRLDRQDTMTRAEGQNIHVQKRRMGECV